MQFLWDGILHRVITAVQMSLEGSDRGCAHVCAALLPNTLSLSPLPSQSAFYFPYSVQQKTIPRDFLWFQLVFYTIYFLFLFIFASSLFGDIFLLCLKNIYVCADVLKYFFMNKDCLLPRFMYLYGRQ